MLQSSRDNRFGRTLIVLSVIAWGSCTLATAAAAAAAAYPCAYADTVNITEALRLKDGSYSFEGLIIPANLTSEYGVKVIDGIEYSAPKHVRGCVCLLKPCISFCCPAGMRFDEHHQNCTNDTTQSGHHPKQLHVEVTFANRSVGAVSIRDAFIVRTEFGCKNKFVDRKHEHFWKWDLFENGTLLRDGKYFTTDEYCFTSLEHKKTWTLTPLNCERFQRGFRIWIYVICATVAVLINICILLMYVAVKEARRSSYGEALLLHLVATIVGFSALIYLSLRNPMSLSHSACRNLGFVAYFFLIVSFLFLNIASWNFRLMFDLKRFKNWQLKLIYILAIALAVGLVLLVKAVQDSQLARHLKPGIGEDFCWFDVRLWGIFLYYYLPILLSLGASLYCCAQAYFGIFRLPADTLNIDGCPLTTAKKHFYAFFVYLLAVVCVWLREMIVFVLARLRELYFIIDFWSGVCVLGLAITGFVCLLRKNVFVQDWWSANVSHSGKNYDYSITPDIFPSHAQSLKASERAPLQQTTTV